MESLEAPDSQFCLKWNNFQSNITKNIDELWKGENYVDCSIYCEGKLIQAHKIILSASSATFKQIFDVNPSRHPVIILQDIKFNVLNALITFIYQGEVNVEQKNLSLLLKAAQTLQIHGLTETLKSNVTKKRKLETESESDFTPKQEQIDISEPNSFQNVVNFDETSIKIENDEEVAADERDSQNWLPPDENHGIFSPLINIEEGSLASSSVRKSKRDPFLRLSGHISDHKMIQIPCTNIIKRTSRRCVVCYANNKRSETYTRYMCQFCDCPLHLGECFTKYHTMDKYY